jgi:hypothetical protein
MKSLGIMGFVAVPFAERICVPVGRVQQRGIGLLYPVVLGVAT